MEKEDLQKNIEIANSNVTVNILKEEFTDTLEKKRSDDIDAVTILKKEEDPKQVFVDVYNKTGDSILAAKIAWKLDTEEGARMKATLILRDDSVIKLIEKDMVKNFTIEKLQGESWLLYKKCMKEGNKIKALELLAKLRGYLSDKFVVNQNYNTWNVLIQQAHREKEQDESRIIEGSGTTEGLSK